MSGRFYGVGVGPGDPEYLTIKAMRVMESCPVIAVPGKMVEETVAYQIAVQACPSIEGKEKIGIYSPMTKDKQVLFAYQEKGVEQIKAFLNQNQDVAFLTLGDPTIYSTYMYLQQRIRKQGYETEIISGIPSFCAAAAKLGRSLGERNEQIHILPASYEVEEALRLEGTKVLMKTGSQYKVLKERLKRDGYCVEAVERCGMEGEGIYRSLEEMPEDMGYYSLIFVREGGKG